MKQEINDGGPAFPNEGGEHSGLHAHPGMTLRDWFAGQALVGLAPLYYEKAGGPDIAGWSYGIADAMLAARNAGGAK